MVFVSFARIVTYKCLLNFQLVWSILYISSSWVLSLPLKYRSNKRNGVISVSSRFHSSQQTWIPDPSFGLSLGPVAPIRPQQLFFFLFTSYAPSFCLISSLFLHITAVTYPLRFTVSLVFQSHFLLPSVSLSPSSLSQFLFSLSAMFCDWQLKLDCNRVNRE